MKKDKVCGGGREEGSGRERKKEGERERRKKRERELNPVVCPSPAEVLPRPQHHGDGELLQSAGFTHTL